MQVGIDCAPFTKAAYRIKYFRHIPKKNNQDSQTFSKNILERERDRSILCNSTSPQLPTTRFRE